MLLPALQGNPRLGVFGGLRERLRSSDALPQAGELIAAGRALSGSAVPGASAGGGHGGLLPGEKHSSEKDLGLDSEGEPASPSAASSAEEEDMECGVCLDAVVSWRAAVCRWRRLEAGGAAASGGLAWAATTGCGCLRARRRSGSPLP